MVQIAWSAFPTLIDGQIWTGAHTQIVRDNFAETAPAKATVVSSHFAGAGANSIAERILQFAAVNAAETTAGTSYTNLTTPGPAVTATTGTKALVCFHGRQSNSSAGSNSWTSVAVSGATTIAASDNWASSYDQAGQHYFGITYIEPNLTAGSNTFTLQYRVSAGTGTFGSPRRINVVPF